MFAFQRRASLIRLLDSLEKAHYENHQVQLEFHLDGEAHPSVRETCEKYRWKHGTKRVFQRVKRVGLMENIMKSWEANDPRELSIFLEDDVKVSPYFFIYLLGVLRSNLIDPSVMFGISLYSPRLNELRNPPEPRDFQNSTSSPVVLAQLPCSWGAAYFPEHWKAFRAYYSDRAFPLVPMLGDLHHIPGTTSNRWNRSWKKYFIEFSYSKAIFMLYPNFPRQRSFSTTYREKGEHTNLKGGIDAADLDRLDDSDVNQFFNVPLIETSSVPDSAFSLQSSVLVAHQLSNVQDLRYFDIFLERSSLKQIRHIAWNYLGHHLVGRSYQVIQSLIGDQFCLPEWLFRNGLPGDFISYQPLSSFDLGTMLSDLQGSMFASAALLKPLLLDPRTKNYLDLFDHATLDSFLLPETGALLHQDSVALSGPITDVLTFKALFSGCSRNHIISLNRVNFFPSRFNASLFLNWSSQILLEAASFRKNNQDLMSVGPSSCAFVEVSQLDPNLSFFVSNSKKFDLFLLVIDVIAQHVSLYGSGLQKPYRDSLQPFHFAFCEGADWLLSRHNISSALWLKWRRKFLKKKHNYVLVDFAKWTLES